MDHVNADVKNVSIVKESKGERAESASSEVAVENDHPMAPHGDVSRITVTPISRMKQDRGASPAVSYLSMKSDWSMGQPGNFKGEGLYPHSNWASVKERASPAPSCLSMKSDQSMGHPGNFKGEVPYPVSSWTKQDRGASPAVSYYSMKSDWSMGQPGNFKGEVAYPHSSWMKQDRGVSPAVSYLSMKSDWSMDQPGNFKGKVPAAPRDFSSKLFTSVHVRCRMCSSTLTDPVSIPCGHSYCKQCINTHWAQPGPKGYFVCPQCEKSYPTHPELSVNMALTWTLQALQQAGFSPACPTLAQAGPGEVACDICSGIKLRAVKTCLTCCASYCESHVRQHYTVPALQKHTMAQVTEDTKLKAQGRLEVIEEEEMVIRGSEDHQEIPSKRMKMAAVSTRLENLQEKGPTGKVSEMIIVLLGPRRSGKSSSGNTILGDDQTKFGLETTAQSEKREGYVAGRRVTVVDTPGWDVFKPLKSTSKRIQQEIVLSKSLCPPGPHALLLVIDIITACKTDICKLVVEHMQLIGERVWRHTIILFTHGEHLRDKSIGQYIESEGEALQRLVEKCGKRYHVLNNKRGDVSQVTELLEKIEEMVAENGGGYY